MKLKKLLQALNLILQKPYLLNEVLQNEERFNEAVTKTYGINNGLPVIDFTDIANPNFTANPYAFLDGGSLPTDLILLKSLAAELESCTYFEIGTWRGESVTNVASVAQQCFTLNQTKEEMRSIGLSEEIINQLRFFSKNIENISHLEGNSFDFDFNNFKNKMNLIFVDGDHTYEGVKNDTEKAFSLLKDENSIIVWHDYAHHPDTVRWEVLNGILDGLHPKEHNNLYAVSNTKCCIYSKKTWKTKPPKSPSTPNKVFEVSVNKV